MSERTPWPLPMRRVLANNSPPALERRICVDRHLYCPGAHRDADSCRCTLVSDGHSPEPHATEPWPEDCCSEVGRRTSCEVGQTTVVTVLCTTSRAGPPDAQKLRDPILPSVSHIVLSNRGLPVASQRSCVMVAIMDTESRYRAR